MAQRRVRSQLLLYRISLIFVRPQGAWVSKTGYPEPLAKPALPAGGTWKPLEASRGCSWSRIFADFVTQPLPDASGVALGSLGVDFGELQAPNIMIFERFFLVPSACAVRCAFWLFAILFSSRFLGCWAARADGPNAKIDTPSMRKPVFQGTRQRRARHRKGNRRPKTTPKVDATRPLNMSTPCDFPRSRARL